MFGERIGVIGAVVLGVAACAGRPAIVPTTVPPPSSTDVTAAEAPDDVERSDWPLLESVDGGFEIRLPGEPEEERATADTGIGELATISWLFADRGAEYLVMVMDYPDGYTAGGASAGILERARDGVIGGLAGRVFEDFEVDVAGPTGERWPGRQIGAETPSGQTYRGRLILARDRLYQLTYLAPSAAADDTAFQLMVRSFRLR